jgi:hypothetical protein
MTFAVHPSSAIICSLVRVVSAGWDHAIYSGDVSSAFRVAYGGVVRTVNGKLVAKHELSLENVLARNGTRANNEESRVKIHRCQVVEQARCIGGRSVVKAMTGVL